MSTIPYTSDGPVSTTPSTTIPGNAQIPGTPCQAWEPDKETIRQVLNGIVTPTLAVLLGEMLETVDASVPNKDQNRAVKKIIRNNFDRAYMEILRDCYPGMQYTFGPGHALVPAEDKYSAIVTSHPK